MEVFIDGRPWKVVGDLIYKPEENRLDRNSDPRRHREHRANNGGSRRVKEKLDKGLYSKKKGILTLIMISQFVRWSHLWKIF